MPKSDRALQILTDICSLPTAPFMEDAVQEYVFAFAEDRGLRVDQDQWGNMLIELESSGAKQPRWVFAAHMDHPAFIAKRMVDSKTLEADFRGYVLADHLKNAKVRFIGADEVVGTVIQAKPLKNLPRTKSATFRVNKPVKPGTMGMFDFGTGRVKGGKFFSRACDDTAGVASALAMMDELTRSKKKPKTAVAILLTRAEEMAFIGAIGACLKPQLLRKSDRLVAIECSAEQPYARQGDGVIIRIGDKTSIFHSGLSYFMTKQAEELAKKDKTFKFQRALMPGGTCESTVYDIYGYIAAAVCVPLGNYHNMDSKRKTMGPEYVDVADWQNMVKLFVHLAGNGHAYEPGHKHLKETVEKRFREVEHLFGL